MVNVKRLPDAFAKKALEQGYLARSVFKLQELNAKFRFLKPNTSVVDFGAAPGSWTQYLAQVLGPKGNIVSVDMSPLKTKASNIRFVQADIFEIDPSHLGDTLNSFHTVVSDAAPSTTGNAPVDHLRSVELCLHISWVWISTSTRTELTLASLAVTVPAAAAIDLYFGDEDLHGISSSVCAAVSVHDAATRRISSLLADSII